MNKGKREQRRNTKIERGVRVKHLLTETTQREQQQGKFSPVSKKIRASVDSQCSSVLEGQTSNEG